MSMFEECEAKGHPFTLTGSGYHWCACARRKEATSETRHLFSGVLKDVRQILAGIDQTETDSDIGWWETSTGAEFGAEKLRKIEELLS
jgi:hypothetical protein